LASSPTVIGAARRDDPLASITRSTLPPIAYLPAHARSLTGAGARGRAG
jgi:hypothetical protein